MHQTRKSCLKTVNVLSLRKPLKTAEQAGVQSKEYERKSANVLTAKTPWWPWKSRINQTRARAEKTEMCIWSEDNSDSETRRCIKQEAHPETAKVILIRKKMVTAKFLGCYENNEFTQKKRGRTFAQKNLYDRKILGCTKLGVDAGKPWTYFRPEEPFWPKYSRMHQTRSRREENLRVLLLRKILMAAKEADAWKKERACRSGKCTLAQKTMVTRERRGWIKQGVRAGKTQSHFSSENGNDSETRGCIKQETPAENRKRTLA